jgi:hypothetical protein
MKNLLAILIVFSFVLTSCKKEEKTYSVIYKIIEKSSRTPTYIARYSLPDGSTQSVGSITKEFWVTDKIINYKANSYLSLSVEGSGGGEYDLYIYINGTLAKTRPASDGFGPQKLEMEISN